MMDKNELATVLTNIVGMRSSSRYTKLIMLKDYVKWCKNVVGIPVCEDVFDFESVGVEKIKKEWFQVHCIYRLI